MSSAASSSLSGGFSRTREVPHSAASAGGTNASAKSHQLNEDFGTVALHHSGSMSWCPSPSPSVYRKRLELSGPKECGRVTSVVRYEPKSHFHSHGHPDGEEIFVLSGTFSDDSGDYPGAEIFVKLRQYSGKEREHIVSYPLQADGSPSLEGWATQTDFTTSPLPDQTNEASAEAGAASEGGPMNAFVLYTSPTHPELTRLLQVPARSSVAPVQASSAVTKPAGAEIFVVRGAVSVQQSDGVAVWKLQERSWLRLPPVLSSFSLCNNSDEAAYVYLKENHLPNSAVA